jgi:polyphosphate kinase
MAKKGKHKHDGHDAATLTSEPEAKGHAGEDSREQATGTNGHGAPRQKMSNKEYLRALKPLQVELVKLQSWAEHTGFRAMIVFEGRDAAGKGGCIKAITERVSPRVFLHVALPTPTEREKSQMSLQRYMAHFPAAGEIVLFDRSWYNRAGVEYVMGFVSEQEHHRFLQLCPQIEQYVIDAGIILIKLWLEVGMEEQEKRFHARIDDPVRQWKLSPTDLESRRRWYDYSKARDMMLAATDTKVAPWHIVRSDDKKRARLNLIAHFLKQIPYERVKREKVKPVGRSKKRAYDDETPMKKRRWIPEVY